MRAYTDPSHPAVSVISPCLNGITYLPQMLASLTAQTFTDWELIFIDDGSTDGSLEFMFDAVLRDPRIVIMQSMGRVGAAVARNIGLSASRGRYVAFLDCDDWWLPDKLTRQIMRMDTTDAAFSCTAYTVCNSSGSEIRTQQVTGPLTSRRHLSKRVVIGCLTVMFDRHRLPNAKFKTSLLAAEDYVLWYELLLEVERLGLTATVIDEPMACYRVHFRSKSSNKWHRMAVHWRVYRDVLGFSVPKAAAYFFSYVVNAIYDRRQVRVRPTC